MPILFNPDKKKGIFKIPTGGTQGISCAFSYSAASYTDADPDPTPTVTGTSGGTFTSTAGIVINADTGEIDLSASAVNTYVVTYTVRGKACTQSVEITSSVNEDWVTKWTVGVGQTITLWSPTGTVSYNYDVDWGDGNTETSITASDKTHDYTDAGADTYTVTITGQFGGLKMSRGSSADKDALVEFVNWGISEVSGMKEMFYGCTKMVYSATDAPDLTNLTASGGTQFYSTFYDCDAITSLDLSGWTNTDELTNFTNAFLSCGSLTTLNLTGWDTSNVTTAVNMCNSAGDSTSGCDFIMPDLDWSASTTFGSAFKRAYVKTIDITGWTLRSAGVTVSSMFYEIYKGSAVASFSVDMTGWSGTDGMTNLSNFGRGGAFTSLDVTGWDTSNVTSFALFAYSSPLTYITGLNGFDASSVTSLNQMFTNCTSLNFGAGATTNFGSNWGPNLGSCTNFASLFSSVGNTTAGTAPPDVSNWDVSAATTFSGIFYRCKWTGGGDIDTSAWEISSDCTTMANFARESSTTIIDLSHTNCDLQNVTTMGSFASNTTSLTRFILNATLDKPNFSSCTNFDAFATNVTIVTGDYDELLLKLDDAGQSGVIGRFGNSEYTPTIVDSGTTDATTADKLVQSGQNFLTTVNVNDIVFNNTDSSYAKVTAVDSNTTLSLEVDIMTSGEDYDIQSSAVAKARYSLDITKTWTLNDGGQA